MKLNHKIILIVTFIQTFIMLGYYHLPIVSDPWQKYSGVDLTKMRPSLVYFVSSLISYLLVSYLTAVLLKALKISTWFRALALGFFLCLCLILVPTLNHFLWENRPFQLWIIDFLILSTLNTCLSSLILFIWQKKELSKESS